MAPTLNQHREAILGEFMAGRESYAPSHREAEEEPVPVTEDSKVTKLRPVQGAA
jgi:hypothetical protein